MIHPDAEPSQDESPAGAAPRDQSRRSFFRRTAAVAAPAALAAMGAEAAAQSAAKITLPNLYPGWNSRNFAELRSDENTHFTYLYNLLSSANALLGPLPQLNVSQLTINPGNQLYFAALASVFENTGTGAYLSALPLLSNPGLTAAAGSILVVEANHSGYLNTLVNYPIVNNGVAFAQPFATPVVLNNIGPYLINPAPVAALANSISTSPSAENDVKILNFALVLEFLEASFYNINVKAIFGV